MKVSCVLSVDKTELHKRVLLKNILKNNIAKGIVPAHEEEERWNKINNTPNHVIRLRLKVTSDNFARKLTT
jgi:hypothetical protein